jgi:hypothetical protein
MNMCWKAAGADATLALLSVCRSHGLGRLSGI